MANDAIDYINRDIVNVKEDLRTISKLVRDGNGQPSLMQQVTMLQGDIVRIEVDLKEQIINLQSSVDSIRSKEKERNTLNWQFKTAIAVAIISSFTSIYLHYMDNKPDNSNTEKVLVQILEKIDKLPKK
ncbi:MAG: hypothetical protein EBR30_00795 [Cytophagia bacterium]|jgi:hypothetical protein|nr:hypothetical protein [Cytophagia bacterium]